METVFSHHTLSGPINSLSYSAIQEAIKEAISDSPFILIYRNTTEDHTAAYLPDAHGRRNSLFHDLCIRYVYARFFTELNFSPRKERRRNVVIMNNDYIRKLKSPLFQIRGNSVRRNMNIEHLKTAQNLNLSLILVSLLLRFKNQLLRIIFYKPSWFVKPTMKKNSQYFFRYLS